MPHEKKTLSALPEKHSRAGFTLVELAIVIFILSSILIIAIPKFQSIFPQAHLLSSARRMAGEVRRLYYEAAFGGRKYSLGFSLETGQYWSLIEMPGGEMKTREGKVRKLLPGVSFVDVVVAGRKMDKGEARVNFLPCGVVEPSIIHLVNSEGEQLSIIINGFTGKVELYDGYKELKITN